MLYLQLGAGISAQSAGLLMLPMAAVSVSLAPFMGRLTDRLPPGRISKIGLSSMITSMALFAVLITFEVAVGGWSSHSVFQGAANALKLVRSKLRDFYASAAGPSGRSRFRCLQHIPPSRRRHRCCGRRAMM